MVEWALQEWLGTVPNNPFRESLFLRETLPWLEYEGHIPLCLQEDTGRMMSLIQVWEYH